MYLGMHPFNKGGKIMQYNSVVDFYNDDFNKTFYPLDTSRVLINNFSEQINTYVKEKVLSSTDENSAFLPQTRVYIPKYDLNLRRTVKLDPIAEFFIYNVIFENRLKFNNFEEGNRVTFGYKFFDNKFASSNSAYKAFKAKINELNNTYRFYIKFDISNYFNSLYHHDICNAFSNITSSNDERSAFGQFLRQINSGRSVDCLPQGIYPCKIIGSNFLQYIDRSIQVKAESLVRFMDDFYLFSDSLDILKQDYLTIQKLLGEKGLSVNPIKTKWGEKINKSVDNEIDEIKLSLLKIRRAEIEVSGWVEEQEYIEELSLDNNQISYLLDMLKNKNKEIEEEDAELVLSLMRHHSEKVLEFIPIFMEKFPNLIKNIFFFIKEDVDKEQLSNIIIDFLEKVKYISAYQLFWITKIIEEHLLEFRNCKKMLFDIYDHKESSIIVKAKILEIPDNSFGLADLREEHLKSGRSDWLSWSSAIGVRFDEKSHRNYMLKYFAKGSSINHLISECICKFG